MRTPAPELSPSACAGRPLNALLGLVRLHVNRRDGVANWTKLLLDGSRSYSLRKHPVPPRATG
jgi:hypothetical protein